MKVIPFRIRSISKPNHLASVERATALLAAPPGNGPLGNQAVVVGGLRASCNRAPSDSDRVDVGTAIGADFRLGRRHRGSRKDPRLGEHVCRCPRRHVRRSLGAGPEPRQERKRKTQHTDKTTPESSDVGESHVVSGTAEVHCALRCAHGTLSTNTGADNGPATARPSGPRGRRHRPG